MDRGAWWSTVQRVAKSQTRLARMSTHSFALQFEIRVHDTSCFVLLSQDCFDCSQSCVTNFTIICFSSAKNASGILIGIALNLYIALVGLVILKILTLLTLEHSIFFHLFVLSSVPFLNVL